MKVTSNSVASYAAVSFGMIMSFEVCVCVCVLLLTDSGNCSADDQQKASDDLRKDASELGIEVIDHISTVAGN